MGHRCKSVIIHLRIQAHPNNTIEWASISTSIWSRSRVLDSCSRAECTAVANFEPAHAIKTTVEQQSSKSAATAQSGLKITGWIVEYATHTFALGVDVDSGRKIGMYKGDTEPGLKASDHAHATPTVLHFPPKRTASSPVPTLFSPLSTFHCQHQRIN
ncbi:hypothetical protein BDQ17DRAFT_1333999 [Cyathus striatus]|nr:hypothetical protein BDQ17DRAFT_1333999 [Cyathus striatus]